MALTEKDLRAIGELIRSTILELVPALIQAEIRGIPTKEEFSSTMDQIMGELQAIRQELVIMSGRVRIHEDRITILEEIHPDGQHSVS